MRSVWEADPGTAELLGDGWVVTERRVAVERRLVPWFMPLVDPFGWEPVAALDDGERTALLTAVLQGTGRTAAWLWSEAMARAGVVSPDWVVARLDRRRVGLILPCIEDGTGWVDLIALTPAARGAGLGRVLHAVALDRLAHLGAVRYLDETDADNTAMRRVFARNGCHELGVRLTLAPPVKGCAGTPRPPRTARA